MNIDKFIDLEAQGLLLELRSFAKRFVNDWNEQNITKEMLLDCGVWNKSTEKLLTHLGYKQDFATQCYRKNS